MTDRLRDEFLAEHGGDRGAAATEMARRLMAGDPATFKMGYSAESALLVVRDVFALGEFNFRRVGVKLGANADFIERHAVQIAFDNQAELERLTRRAKVLGYDSVEAALDALADTVTT